MLFRGFILLQASLLLLGGCSKDESGTLVGPFTSTIGTISKGVQTTGKGMNPNALALTTENAILAVTPMTGALCDVHGQPLLPVAEGGTSMPQADARYPFVHTYCAMTINDGDTVLGGFTLAKGLICSLEKGHIAFAGAPQSITVDFTDRDCWPSGGPGGSGGPTTGTLVATGTSPASFNSHFEKGVSFTFAEGPETLTFKIAANFTGSTVEFIAHESWTNGNIGVMAGSLNQATGALSFEKRDQRIHAGCSSGGNQCFNRHTRLKANLTMTGGEPTGLTSLSYGWSDVGTSDEVNHNGRLVTAGGTLSGGIKARFFNTGAPNTAGYVKTQGNWAETVGTGCMTGSGVDTGANCAGNTGIPAFTTNTNYALFSTGTPLSPAAFLAGFTGFTFTSVNLDTDQAY